MHIPPSTPGAPSHQRHGHGASERFESSESSFAKSYAIPKLIGHVFLPSTDVADNPVAAVGSISYEAIKRSGSLSFPLAPY